MSFRDLYIVLFAFLVGGCATQSSPKRIDTGAESAAKSFFEALLREDWSVAYDSLDPDSRSRWNKEQFVTRAQAAMRQIGFTPTAVNVSVTESGNEASAIAVYRETSAAGAKQYKDGTALKRVGQTWTVVLRNNFGVVAPVPPGKSGKRKNG